MQLTHSQASGSLVRQASWQASLPLTDFSTSPLSLSLCFFLTHGLGFQQLTFSPLFSHGGRKEAAMCQQCAWCCVAFGLSLLWWTGGQTSFLSLPLPAFSCSALCCFPSLTSPPPSLSPSAYTWKDWADKTFSQAVSTSHYSVFCPLPIIPHTCSDGDRVTSACCMAFRASLIHPSFSPSFPRQQQAMATFPTHVQWHAFSAFFTPHCTLPQPAHHHTTYYPLHTRKTETTLRGMACPAFHPQPCLLPLFCGVEVWRRRRGRTPVCSLLPGTGL